MIREQLFVERIITKPCVIEFWKEVTMKAQISSLYKHKCYLILSIL